MPYVDHWSDRGVVHTAGVRRGLPASYPMHLVEHACLADGTALCLRPICAHDLTMHARFTETLSAGTHYARFLSPRKIGMAELKRMTDIDYGSELALVATIDVDGLEHEIGVARYVGTSDHDAGAAVVVADRWQRRGIAETLLRKLIAAAAQHGVTHIADITACDNRAMLALARKLGFAARRDPADPYLIGLSLRLAH